MKQYGLHCITDTLIVFTK